MDPVLLKRTLREIMLTLSLHGTILRHPLGSSDGNPIAFATFIAFECPISKATEYVEKIITQVKSLPMMSGLKFTSDFPMLSNTMHPHPNVTGISIAETDALYSRQNSSGLRYHNPTTSKTGDIIKGVQRLAGPTRDLVQYYTGTRYYCPFRFCQLIIIVPARNRKPLIHSPHFIPHVSKYDTMTSTICFPSIQRVASEASRQSFCKD
jgi:hypothetical protein